MNDPSKKTLPSWLPLVVGFLLVVQFAGLGVWQISRGLEKRATQNLYRDESGFTTWQHGAAVRPYQRLRIEGRFDSAHQVILENIIINSRYGYYIITPLELGDDVPVLLINRGWIEKGATPIDSALLELPAEPTIVHGRAGSLPRAGYKMGSAVTQTPGWPKYAVYPSVDEVSAALGRELQPFVLLMDHEEAGGFYRHWVPTEFGPGKHFGYALQWFAMGAVLAGLLVWNYRKKRFDS